MTAPLLTRSKLMGVLVTSLALLVFEITLTRVFSVVLWYHFAFLAISLALFGLGAGGLLLHFFPERFPREAVDRQMARFALFFAFSMPGAFLLILGVPFIYRISFPAFVSLTLIYLFAATPFVLGGVVLALALSRYSDRIGLVYGMDLIGAGLGCALAVPLLDLVSGPGAVFATGAAAAVAAALFSSGVARAQARRSLAAAAALLALLAVHETTGLFRIDFAKDELEAEILYEQWNSMARVSVTERGTVNWATSEAYKGPRPETLWLKIDAEAGTPIVRFTGDFDEVRAIQYDVTALAYTLRDGARTAIIGPGGGRDVLTALSFGHGPVTGVEINPAIIEAVRGRFGEYAGGLYDRPDTRIVSAEGRSFLRRSEERFDIIQASLIDTWAATSAGAYVLSENNLYTREAFVDFLNRLTPEGILTLSRWFFKGRPIETLRLTGTALAALRELGVENPEAHVMVVKRSTWDWAYRVGEFRDGVGTLLVKRAPWVPGEVEHIRRLAEELHFEVIYAPGLDGHPDFERLARIGPEAMAAEYPVDISPPTDDRPFFFFTLRPIDALRRLFGGGAEGGIEQGVVQHNVRAMFVLAALLLIVLALTLVFLVAPRLARRGESFPRDGESLLFLAYFLALGLGYLLVEIPLMQRFILFLGHPVLALSVVLLAMLVGSGAGSLLSARIPQRLFPAVLLLVVAAVGVSALLLPRLFAAAIGLPFPARVALTIIVLAPPAFLMGIPFPAGIRLLGASRAGMVPWIWGVNGAASVTASVLATILAIAFGYTRVLLIGGAVYVGALAALIAIRRGSSPEGRESPAP